jgi:superoxide dismutase
MSDVTENTTVEMFDGPMPRRDFLKLAGTGLGAMLLGGSLLNQDAKALKLLGKRDEVASLSLSSSDTLVLARAKDFSAISAGFDGLSAEQVQAHVKLYHGYVKKHASITQQLSDMSDADLEGANPTYHPYRALFTEQSYALNGALLHEYYFENLSTSAQSPSFSVQKAMSSAFGSMDRAKAQLMAAAKSMRGWAVMGLNMWDGQLHIYGLDTHNTAFGSTSTGMWWNNASPCRSNIARFTPSLR